MDSCGQALTQSPHLVQHSRKSASLTAPGGRSQSVRPGGAVFSGGASAWAAYALAALATERTESLKKSRRPYLGTEAISDFRSQISNLFSQASHITPFTSHRRRAACRLPRNDRRRRTQRPIPDDFRG